MSQRASVIIAAPHETIVEVLCDLGELDTWNPALGPIRADGPARTGQVYRTRIRGVVPARIEFTTIGRHRVDYRMTALGNAEEGSWQLAPEPEGVRVTHAFTHSGAILSLMAPAFAEVAGWRTGRLAAEVRERVAPRNGDGLAS